MISHYLYYRAGSKDTMVQQCRRLSVPNNDEAEMVLQLGWSMRTLFLLPLVRQLLLQ